MDTTLRDMLLTELRHLGCLWSLAASENAERRAWRDASHHAVQHDGKHLSRLLDSNIINECESESLVVVQANPYKGCSDGLFKKG